jgi:hypothetical protein
MELWLLGAGAIILIGIALWIVWPARASDAVPPSDPKPEVSPMTDSGRQPANPPDGDRFEDQYTSATADLSAAGVAASLSAAESGTEPEQPHRAPTQDPVVSTRGQSWPEADVAGERIGRVEHADTFPYGLQSPASGSNMPGPRKIGVGAGVLLSLGSAVVGAWLYGRWHRERNKPINRLRRGARDVALRFGEYAPSLDDLSSLPASLPLTLPQGRAPLGGAATALALTALLGTRALRRRSPPDHPEQLREHARELLHEAFSEALAQGRSGSAVRSELAALARALLDRGRDELPRLAELSRAESRRLADRGRDEFPKLAARGLTESRRARERLAQVEPESPGVFGLGFGGLAIVAGGAFLIWRVLRGGGNSGPRPGDANWYADEG